MNKTTSALFLTGIAIAAAGCARGPALNQGSASTGVETNGVVGTIRGEDNPTSMVNVSVFRPSGPPTSLPANRFQEVNAGSDTRFFQYDSGADSGETRQVINLAGRGYALIAVNDRGPNVIPSRDTWPVFLARMGSGVNSHNVNLGNFNDLVASTRMGNRLALSNLRSVAVPNGTNQSREITYADVRWTNGRPELLSRRTIWEMERAPGLLRLQQMEFWNDDTLVVTDGRYVGLFGPGRAGVRVYTSPSSPGEQGAIIGFQQTLAGTLLIGESISRAINNTTLQVQLRVHEWDGKSTRLISTWDFSQALLTGLPAGSVANLRTIRFSEDGRMAVASGSVYRNTTSAQLHRFGVAAFSIRDASYRRAWSGPEGSPFNNQSTSTLTPLAGGRYYFAMAANGSRRVFGALIDPAGNRP